MTSLCGAVAHGTHGEVCLCPMALGEPVPKGLELIGRKEASFSPMWI